MISIQLYPTRVATASLRSHVTPQRVAPMQKPLPANSLNFDVVHNLDKACWCVSGDWFVRMKNIVSQVWKAVPTWTAVPVQKPVPANSLNVDVVNNLDKACWSVSGDRFVHMTNIASQMLKAAPTWKAVPAWKAVLTEHSSRT